jgi:hypothetical protein
MLASVPPWLSRKAGATSRDARTDQYDLRLKSLQGRCEAIRHLDRNRAATA